MKPRVFIAMASTILGGPGKGLEQFLRHGGLEGCCPLMVAYTVRPEEDTEYIAAMRATGAPVAVLRQKRTLDAGLVPQALDLIAGHGITVLQSHGYKSHVLCWLLRRRTGLPWVAYVHGWTAEDLKIRLYTALEHGMLLLADRVVAVSGSLRQRLLLPARRKCLVIPNAVAPEELRADISRETARERLGFSASDVVAGVVGRLSPEKGHAVFLRAFARARSAVPRLRALIVGDGQEGERLKALARELCLTDACRFTGHVRGMAACYSAMDLLALPSFAEGMPNAALEAMYMGLPVIASRVGGVPEVVEHGKSGLLVGAGDEKALENALTRLAVAPEARAAMGEAGSARIRARFIPEERTRSMLAVYRGLLSGGNAKEAGA